MNPWGSGTPVAQLIVQPLESLIDAEHFPDHDEFKPKHGVCTLKKIFWHIHPIEVKDVMNTYYHYDLFIFYYFTIAMSLSTWNRACTVCHCFRSSCLLSKYRPSQLCAAWFYCLHRLSAQAISLCSAFMGNLGLLGDHSLEEIYHRNTGRQFNNAAVDSWEKPGIYLM